LKVYEEFSRMTFSLTNILMNIYKFKCIEKCVRDFKSSGRKCLSQQF